MDDMDRNEVRERKIQVHIAGALAIRKPETREFIQRCDKCGRALRTFSEATAALVMYSESVAEKGLPAGTFLAITRDAQYITGPRLGINEEFCS